MSNFFSIKLNQKGKTLLEMVGVLVLVGILTVGVIYGYSYALIKQKAGATIYELEKRAVIVSAFLMSNQGILAGEELEMDLEKITALGYEIGVQIPPQNEAYFEQIVAHVPRNVCRQILKEYSRPVLISVGGVTYLGDEAICVADNLDMNFYYQEDLSPKKPCSDKGMFDENSLACKCIGNTYQDVVTGDCLCPAGHIWSAVEKTCVESVCQEGAFETLLNGCVLCEDVNTYQISSEEKYVKACRACPNRYFRVPFFCPHTCAEGFVSGMSGICYSCEDTKNAIYMSSDDQAACEACSNRYYSQNHCILTTYCNSSSVFMALRDGYPSCISCDTEISYALMEGEMAAQLCRNCTNKGDIKNRDIVDKKCVKVVCDTDEFKGVDGVCYKCNNAPNIVVNEGSGCEAPTCGRVVQDGICLFQTCSSATHVQTTEGCFPCEMMTSFLSTKEACETSCSGSTSKRRWMGESGQSEGYCRLNNCLKGVSYPYSNPSDLICYKCEEGAGVVKGVGVTGLSEYEQEYCEACGNYIVSTYCVSLKACQKGIQFHKRRISNYEVCVECEMSGKIQLLPVNQQIDMCLACQTRQRFYAEEYCYRCDDLEAPFVAREVERASCLACGIRQIINNKCVLKQ